MSNTETANRGFRIANCEVRENRARGLRITSGGGEIIGNTIDGCSAQGILFECDTKGFWPPKRWVDDVTVRGNEILDAGMTWMSRADSTGILTLHRPGPDASTVGYPHHDLTIEGNTIERTASAGVILGDASGVDVTNNEITDPNQLDYDSNDYGFVLEHSGEISLSGNHVGGETGGGERPAFGYERDTERVTVTENTVASAGGRTAAELLRWVPITFRFDQVVVPAEQRESSTDNRSLALRLTELSLLEDAGNSVLTADVGSDEEGLTFGEGVHAPASNDEESWRWLGGPTAEATLYARSDAIEAASQIELRGYPIVAPLGIDLAVDGSDVGQVTFEEKGLGTASVSLQ
jgi:hypothetical protein